MNFDDPFKPYSPEIKGDLEKYLKKHNGIYAPNLFYGPKYFFIIKDKGLIVPYATWVRVDLSPVPDLDYFVNSNFLLESTGQGKRNMSLMGAKKGIYDPNEALKEQRWSISGLKF